MAWNVRKIYPAVAQKMRTSRIPEESWMTPQFTDEVQNGFTPVPLVAAGDGGVWVPTYVYLTAEEAGRKKS